MIVTSLAEGGPSSAKEALACGIPVVSVAVGDTELFAEAPDGIRCAEATPAALATALGWALERRGRPRANLLPRELTLPEAARAMEAVYRAAVGQDPAAG